MTVQYLKFDGVQVPMPTSFRWEPREDLGTDGNGAPIYGGVRFFQMTWQLMSPGDFSFLHDKWYNQGGTGTVVSTLPVLHSGVYIMADYTGTILEEPQVGDYFTEYITNVTLKVRNVVTGR